MAKIVKFSPAFIKYFLLYCSLYQPVRLVSRPWRSSDGTVIRPTLRTMLETVMAYIMTNPGVTLTEIINKRTKFYKLQKELSVHDLTIQPNIKQLFAKCELGLGLLDYYFKDIGGERIKCLNLFIR